MYDWGDQQVVKGEAEGPKAEKAENSAKRVVPAVYSLRILE